MTTVILLLFMLLASGRWTDGARASIAPTVAVSSGSSPQLAVDERGTVRMVFGRGDTILSVTSTDHGITFSAPSVVGVVTGMHLGNTRGPVVASSTQRSLVTAIGKAGDIRAFQIDHATNRSTPLERSVNDRAGSAPEGLMTLAADGDRFAAAWLDNREQRRNQIYFTTIDPRAPRAVANVRVYAAPDGPVCECCRPTIALSKGTVAIMFRNTVGGYRDMYLATSRDAGRTFPDVRKLGTGTWLLDACPMDGGDMEISANGRVSSVWRRDGTIYQARPAAPESLVAMGRSPMMSMRGDTTFVIWQSGSSIRMKAAGSKVETLVGEGRQPQLATLRDGRLLAAWQHNGKIFTRRF